MNLAEKIEWKANQIALLTKRGYVNRTDWRWKHQRESYTVDCLKIQSSKSGRTPVFAGDDVTSRSIVSGDRYFLPTGNIWDYVKIVVPLQDHQKPRLVYYRNKIKVRTVYP